jgi:hypothetical protein
MKKIILLLLLTIGVINSNINAQTFWTENFTGGSTGLQVGSYTGPNGSWSNNRLSLEGASPNIWYVSCTEGGKLAGTCGAICTAGDLGATLHLGANPAVTGDIGAAYFAGGCTTSTSYYGYVYTYGVCAATDRRAESPVINCSARAGITLSYYYIENGDSVNDNGTVWYYNGSGWALLEDPPRTATCAGSQGVWAHRTIALPASANHNPNVKLGFRWVNNEDGIGSDPSFAVDSVSLSATPAPVASFSVTASTTCQDSCVTFTNTTAGPLDSFRWSMPGMSITTPTSSPVTVCFSVAGTFTMHLYVYNASGVDSTTHVITVNRAPHPTILHPSGHLLTVPTGYLAYQWLKGFPVPALISGATSATYTYSASGTYWALVDSAGCWGGDTIVIAPVSVPSVGGLENKYWVTAAGSGGIVINASVPLEEDFLISIFDANGRELINDRWTAGSKVRQVGEMKFPPGLYTIRLSNRHESQVIKWMSQ